MYVSVFMGPFARGPGEDIPLIDLCLEQAAEADKAGFAMVTFGEQHFNNYEPYCNPFMMGARLAPELKRAYFGTTICPLPLQNPLRLAENANILDVLTRGKFILGLSAGRVGFTPDFENFGLDPKDRDQIFATKYDALKQIWAHKYGDEPLVFDTPWFKGQLFGRMMPMSFRAGRPLHAMGTNTDATIRLVAASGTPVFLGPCQLKDAARKLAIYREAATEAGHDAATIEQLINHSIVLHHVIVGETDEEAWDRAEIMMGMNPLMNRRDDGRSLRQMSEADETDPNLSEVERKNTDHVKSWVIAGSPQTVTRQILAHGEAGVPHVHTRFTVGAYNPDHIRASFALFNEEVMPRLSPRQFVAPSGEGVREEYRAAVAGEVA